MTSVRVITQNEQAIPLLAGWKVQDDFARILDAADLYCWQELWNPYYKWRLRKVFRKKDGWSHATTGLAGTAVTFRASRFRYLWSFNKHLHGAVSGISGYRRMRGVVLRDRETDEVITLLSTHFAPKKGRPPRREKAVDKGFKNLVEFVTHHVKMGRTVIVGMDANENAGRIRKEFGYFIHNKPVKIQTSAATGIDHIVVVGDVKVLKRTTFARSLIHSDHVPTRIEFRW